MNHFEFYVFGLCKKGKKLITRLAKETLCFRLGQPLGHRAP